MNASNEFLSEAQEVIEAFARHLLAIEDQIRSNAEELDPDNLNAAFRAVHTLKGLASMSGEAAIVRLSHELESCLDALRLGKRKVDRPTLDALFEAVDVFGRLLVVAAKEDGIAPDISLLCARLSGAALPESDSNATGIAWLDEALLGVLTEYEEHRLRENLRLGRRIFRVHAAFDLMAIDIGIEGLKSKLKSVGEVITYLPSADATADDRIELDIIVGSKVTLSELAAAVDGDSLGVTELGGGAALSGLDGAGISAPTGVAAGGTRGAAPSVGIASGELAATSPGTAPTSIPTSLGQAGAPRGASASADAEPVPPSAGASPPKERGEVSQAGAAPGTAPLSPAPAPMANAATTAPSSSSPQASLLGGAAGAGSPAQRGRGLEVTREPDEHEVDPESSEVSLRSLSQTVRVDLRRLDLLMNLVGELGLVQASLSRLVEEMRVIQGRNELYRSFQEQVRVMTRKLDLLQEGILDVRMVPLGQVFDKLARVVRKLGREAGKDIRLNITGADTELDKLIVEELSDPLMHMIRNAIDHGIERPDERTRAGKQPWGRIELRAFQKGNRVVIEVEDDGRGIDWRKVRDVAVARGFLAREDGVEIAPQSALNLIFLPGFSTRAEASELSGRGVGMDVVKTNIARLSGMIDIHTEPGKGVCFSITLPVTLAIIQALVIESGGQTFCIPLNAVLESIMVQRREIATVEGHAVVTVRGKTLPLVSLAKLFELERSDVSGKDRLYVVVVGLAQHRVGLVVDELLGQQDVVIKTLGRALRQIPGLAGATELGANRTVLLLDVATLVAEAIGNESNLGVERSERGARGVAGAWSPAARD